MKIYKYPLQLGVTVLNVPFGSRVLSVGLQRGQPMAWVEIADGDYEITLSILTVGTGHEFEVRPDSRFIGTIIIDELQLVVHCYQL